MSTTSASLFKNLILLVLLTTTVLSLFYRVFTTQTLLIIQLVSGLLYVFLSIFEFSGTSYKAQLPVARFAYFPNSFYMFRAIKAGMYLMFALALFYSDSPISRLYPICVTIAFTEIVITVLKVIKKLCFVSIYANYILIAKESLVKIFASEIEGVEYRHDIIYFIKKNHKTEEIKLFSIENKAVFFEKIKEWFSNNKINISKESSEKLSS